MKIQIASALLALAPLSALAAPALIVTPQEGKGNQTVYQVEFAADANQPVAALIYEFELDNADATKIKVGQNSKVNVSKCGSGVRAPFSAMCNPATAAGNVRVVIYSMTAGAALPSGTLGQISMPRNLAKRTADGGAKLSFVEFTSPEGVVINGETLVDAPRSAK